MLPPDSATFRAEYVQRHSRLTTFFRFFMLIPQYVVQFFYSIAAGLATFIAWFAVVITARYPAGLYEFVAGYARYSARVSGYGNLLTDVYPPFSGAVDPAYPVELAIGPPKDHYSRLLAFFRIILMIPVAIIQYVLGIVVAVVVFLSWIVIVVTGRLPEGLHRVIAYGVSYSARSSAYGSLLTEKFPSLDGGPPQVDGSPGVPAGSYGA